MAGSVEPVVERLVEVIADVADASGPDFDVAEVLYTVASGSVDLLHADTASVQIADEKGVLDTIATCGEDDRYAELFASHTTDGPGAESYQRASVVSEVDLDRPDTRWPTFAAKARTLGFRSVHGIPMRSRDHVVGGLTLLRSRPGPLTEAEVAIALCLTTVATASIVHDRAQRSQVTVRRQLEDALDSRVIIEQAKGYLARHHGESPRDAFTRLRSHSRGHGLRIGVVAEEVLSGGLDL
jgi:GAF domain-containing protein